MHIEAPIEAIEVEPAQPEPREVLDVVPLLKSYRDALLLSRAPPPSLALRKWLRWLHLRLRPRWMTHYFTVRYVRARTAALERALGARTAVGEADDNDVAECDAISRFKASLPPAPSRIFTVAGAIGAILLSQALLGQLVTALELRAATSASKPTDIERAFDEISLTPDVKSVGDIGRALLSADYIEHGLLLVSILGMLYLFGRPLASGYRLSYLCLGRPERLTRIRERSELCRAAERLDIDAREQAAARAAHAQLRREAPFDLLVKTLPWIAVTYWLVGVTRFEGTPHVHAFGFVVWMLLGIAAAAGIGVWLVHRLRTRLEVGPRPRWLRVLVVGACLIGALGLIVAAFPVLVEFLPGHAGDTRIGDWVWIGFCVAGAARVGWLALQARRRAYPMRWVLGPVALISILALLSQFDPDAPYKPTTREARGWALEEAGILDPPALTRSELQILLATDDDMTRVDLRGQDLHGLSLGGRDLRHAQLALANLRGADVAGADLRGADLRGVLARYASFHEADLRGANMWCSDLRGADLRGTKLAGADATGAIVDPETMLPASLDPKRYPFEGPGVPDPYDEHYTGMARLYNYVWACVAP